jgi:class 3 adenylate cyclase/tetratricopeptide (TPR) repeat protein
VTVCTSCGRQNESDARYCSACGRPLAPLVGREERKAVTVLFCDLVDFTSHTERLDPETVRAIQSPYYGRVRAELERYGGTVEKFIGDAVVALFGAPTAHEDDPERAVRASLAIRDWAAEHGELRVRIAITTGEALVDLEADPLRGEGMASGDVVNTAARLQAAAPENGVLVDATTYHATQDVFEYRKARAIAAKGKAEPIAAWEAVGARVPIRPTRQPRAPFVGREHELAVLREAFATSLADSSTRLVSLIGVPGIGKSRLVHEFVMAIERDSPPMTWRLGRSLPYGASVTLWALGEVVKAHAGILESDGGREADEKLDRAVAAVLGQGRDADWVHAHLRPLVLASDDYELGGDRRAEAFAAWRRFFEALAEERPLVLVLEDVHWADDTLLDFVEYVVEWATEVPLLVLVTSRPELLDRRPAWATSKPNARTLTLAPLSDEETTRLLVALLDRTLLEAEVGAKLLTQARGNPLYAEEYVRLLASGEPGAGRGTAPETVQGIIAARIDGLSVEKKALLQDAAVIGEVFWSGGVGVLARRDRWAVEERLLALERRDLLRREHRSALAGETQYVFSHELVRDVAYNGIPHAERADKHLQAVEWIESLGRSEDHVELLAHHYLSALEYTPGDDPANARLVGRARIALRDAGDRASTLNAFAQAARFYREALRLWPAEEPGRPQLLFGYASALHVTGDPERERLLEEARSSLLEVGDLETAAHAELLLAEMWWYRARGDRLEQHLELAASLLEGRATSPAKARVLAAVARFRGIAEDVEEEIRVARDALALAEELDLAELRADALITLGTGRYGLGDESGKADVERGIALALEANALRVAGRGYNNLATLVDDKAEGIELLAQSLQVAERLGDIERVRFARAHMAGEMFEHGDWDEALEIADAFLTEFEAGYALVQEPGVRTMRAWIHLARGSSDRALTDVERAVALARTKQAPEGALDQLAYAVILYTELGRFAEAQALADEVLARGATAVARHGLDLAFVADRIGRSNAVRESLEAAPPGGGGHFREIAELVAAGDLARAAERAHETGFWSTEADTRLLAGRRLVEQGMHEEANEHLEKALAFYRSVGAKRFIREIEELRAMKHARV